MKNGEIYISYETSVNEYYRGRDMKEGVPGVVSQGEDPVNLDPVNWIRLSTHIGNSKVVLRERERYSNELLLRFDIDI